MATLWLPVQLDGEQGSERVRDSPWPHSPSGQNRAAAGSWASPCPSLWASLASYFPSPPLSALCPSDSGQVRGGWCVD